MGEPIRTVLPPRGGAPETPAYAVLPASARRGVVVLHEILGPQPEIERVVERFAGGGYAAVMPDLFSTGPKVVCIARAIAATASGRGEQIEQIRSAAAWLSERAGIPRERIGVIGFCLGGGFALAAGSDFSAVSTNYGEVPPTNVMRGIGPVIGCYGARDRIFGRHAQKLESRLRPLGVEVETHTFDTVGHSFLTDGDHPIASRLSQPILRIAYDAAVADAAWARIFAFFDRHLGEG